MNIKNLMASREMRLSAACTANVVNVDAVMLFKWGGEPHYIKWDDIIDEVGNHHIIEEYTTHNDWFDLSDEDGMVLFLKDLLRPLDGNAIIQDVGMVNIPVSYLPKYACVDLSR